MIHARTLTCLRVVALIIVLETLVWSLVTNVEGWWYFTYMTYLSAWLLAGWFAFAAAAGVAGPRLRGFFTGARARRVAHGWYTLLSASYLFIVVMYWTFLHPTQHDKYPSEADTALTSLLHGALYGLLLAVELALGQMPVPLGRGLAVILVAQTGYVLFVWTMWAVTDRWVYPFMAWEPEAVWGLSQRVTGLVYYATIFGLGTGAHLVSWAMHRLVRRLQAGARPHARVLVPDTPEEPLF